MRNLLVTSSTYHWLTRSQPERVVSAHHEPLVPFWTSVYPRLQRNCVILLAPIQTPTGPERADDPCVKCRSGFTLACCEIHLFTFVYLARQVSIGVSFCLISERCQAQNKGLGNLRATKPRSAVAKDHFRFFRISFPTTFPNPHSSRYSPLAC
jgi:hypothetical protein